MIELNKKKLCESCFFETDKDPCPECGFSAAEFAPDPLVLPMGTKLNDKIVIGRVIGKGGFGVTYLGYDLRMEKTICVKEYYPNGIAYRSPGGTEISINDPKSAEAFEKGAEKFYSEAEMVAQFNGNPNIVSVYDYFRENNTVYLIMEFIQGVTLKNYVKKHGRLSDGQALYVMDKIAAALSITHSAGVLHRDISPDNIMICRDGKVKLIDFGAARQIMAESSSNLTVVMKPGYTPIEQYTKKGRQGAWTDIYSLGVSIYYGLTEVIIDDPYARMDDDTELAANTHGINNDLWNILKKCTMINSSDRYGSAIDLRKALKSVSAPIKAEPITLSDEDLKAETETVPEKTEVPEKAEEKEAPVMETVPEKTEAIERFETENLPPPDNDEAVKEAFKSKKDEGKADDTPKPNEKAEKVPETADEGENPKSKKPLIIGIAAAAVAVVIGVVGIFAASGNSEDSITADNPSVTESEGTGSETESTGTGTDTEENMPSAAVVKDGKIVIDNNDLLWSMNKAISADTVNSLDGDVRVTLKLIRVNLEQDSEGNYWREVTVRTGENSLQPVKAVSLVQNGSSGYNLDDSTEEFVFILPENFKKNMKDRMWFDVHNLTVTSAVLEEEKYDKSFDFEDFGYPEDWNIMAYIPVEELKAYGGDVRITVDTEIGRYAGADMERDGTIPLSYIHPVDADEWFKLNVSADNLPKPEGDYMYTLVGTGDRQFSFVITQEELARCGENIAFQVYNCVVKKVSIKSAEEADVTTASAAEPKYIPLNSEYQGDWNYSEAIKKTSLKDFTGDIKVTLDVELVEEDAWSTLVFEDGTGKAVDIQACNMGRNYDNTYVFFKGQTQFAFVVTRDVFEKIGREIRMQGSNVWVKGATVENYDPKDDEPSPNAKIIQLDSKYQGSWESTSPIPKSELEAFGGDVRVTLNLEIVKEDLEPTENNHDNSEYWVQIAPNTSREDGIVYVNADYVTPTSWADGMYLLYDRNVPDKFTFVITQEEIARLDNVGLYFRGNNFIAKSAALESADVNTASAAEPLYIPLNDKYQGDWAMGYVIQKSDLKRFEGDIKITLDIELVDEDEDAWSALRIEDFYGNPIDINAFNTGRDHNDTYNFYKGETEFAFVVTKEVFDGIASHIQMIGQNVWVKGATVEDYNPKDDTPSPETKIVQLNGKYRGWWVGSDPIPKKELEAIGGDVRVILNIEHIKQDLVPEDEGDNNGSEYWAQITPTGRKNNEPVSVHVKADYVTPCTWYDGMYVLKDNAVPDRFTFVITEEEIAELDDDAGLFFNGTNIIYKSAYLEKA